MIRERIKKDIRKTISNFKFQISNGEIEVRRTSDQNFGDFSTNIALKIAKVHPLGVPGSNKAHPGGETGSKQSPMEFAKILADSLQNLPYLKKLEVKEPGFINFFIKDEVWQKQAEDVLNQGPKYGANEIGKSKKARVEFISANPTGPLHFGNARGGPIGDSLASVLEFSGYKVLREYLHDDVGMQVQKLGESIINLTKGCKLEDQEYKGEYIRGLAKKIGKVKNAKEAGEKAVKILLDEILADTKSMGIKYDKVYPESEFGSTGITKKALEALDKKKVLKKQKGAVWFAPSDQFLRDRECVVVKSDGAYTYFANDIAYHKLKFDEGYDLVIDILGANHHGHIPRLQAAISAFGFDVSKFTVILYQWVRFKRGTQVVKMAKRAGTFVTVREVLGEVGKDALRFFILMHDANSHIDFDLDLAKEHSSKNPVYYVQYAHARIASILKKVNGKWKMENGKFNHQLLTTNYELDLIKQITKLPELIEEIATSFAVHRLTGYAVELADSFHRFYENCPVITEGEELKTARLALCMVTKIALANTLSLLGVSAPDKM